MLEVIGSDPAAGEFVVIAGLGPSADWFRNLAAGPAVEVAVGQDRFRPVHRILAEDEAAEALADYERRNRVVAPIVRAVLSRLVGWHYDGGVEARLRLVRERPLVGLRPDPERTRAGA